MATITIKNTTAREEIIKEIENVLVTANNTPFEQRKGKVIILNLYELEYLVKLMLKLKKC